MKDATLTALRVFIVAALGFLLLAQTVVLPWMARDMAADAPEFVFLQVPLLVVLIVDLACVQAVLACTWPLLTLTRRGEVFSDGARPWVDAIIVALAAGCVLGIGTGFWLGSVPGVGPITVIVTPVLAGVASGAAALLMTVMRSLLVKATENRTELAGVV